MHLFSLQLASSCHTTTSVNQHRGIRGPLPTTPLRHLQGTSARLASSSPTTEVQLVEKTSQPCTSFCWCSNAFFACPPLSIDGSRMDEGRTPDASMRV